MPDSLQEKTKPSLPAGTPRQPIPKQPLTWLIVCMLWWVHWWPEWLLRTVAVALGNFLFILPTSRKKIGLCNLALCFPQRPATWRRQILRKHCVELATMFLEYAYLWFSTAKRLRRLMQVEGMEHLQAAAGQPVILCMPHFSGLDFAGLRISMETPVVSIYSRQKSNDLDAWVEGRRLRFATGKIMSRQEGIRPVLRALRQGYRLYYLPDQDFGPKDSVFVSFFGVQAATITGLSRMAQASGAQIIPCYPRRERKGYTLVLEAPIKDYPGGDNVADARRMNAWIEQQIVRQPEQYFWLHKRFKTRPPGEASYYQRT